MFQYIREEDRLEALEGFQQLLIKQSRGDHVEDIGTRDTNSCDNQKRDRTMWSRCGPNHVKNLMCHLFLFYLCDCL